MKIATNVLNWSSDGSADSAEVNAPFKIDVVSQGATIYGGRDAESFHIKIYAYDWWQWSVDGKGSGATLPAQTASEPGIAVNESAKLSGSNTLSPSYPADAILSPIPDTPTGIISDADFSYIYTAGSYPGMLRALSLGDIELTDQRVIDEGGHGVIDFRYQSKSAQVYKVTLYEPGIHYFLCHVPGTERKAIIEIEFLEPVTTSVEVRDYCSDSPIPGASIQALGTIWTADGNGVVNFGKLSPGQTIPVVISAGGYHDSDADTLNNDTITT